MKSDPRPVRILAADDETSNLDAYRNALSPTRACMPGETALCKLEVDLFGSERVAVAEPVFDVTFCSQSAQAVAAVREALIADQPFSVAFLDVRMPPGLDGIWAAEQMRALDPYISIVLVTGYSDVDVQVVGARLQPPDKLLFIQKPFFSQEVYQFAVALSAKWQGERDLRTHSAELARVNAELRNDIEVRQRAERTLRLLQAAIEHTEDSTIIIQVAADDSSDRIVYVNPAFTRTTGYTLQETGGNSIFMLAGPQTDRSVLKHMRDQLRVGKPFAGEITAYRKDLSTFVMNLRIDPVLDPSGEINHWVAIMRDVTEASLVAQETAYQATHDSLTGLPNRREFERRLRLMQKHAKDQGRQHALCYIDLDQFKVVNDTCGHSAGDELLGQLSALLKSQLRDRDTLARLGGDEFGVILGECPLDQAVRIANQLRENIQDYRYSWGTKLFRIGASIGVVPITEACDDPAYLLSAADNACYAAKEQGRDRVHVFEPGNIDLVRRQSEMQWIPRLHRALAENQFQLYVQPIIPLNAAGDQIHGEVLLRLRDDTGEQYLPGVFIPAAERFHQMLAIDRWVVRATLAALGQCCPAQSTFSINLSGQSVGNIRFLDFVIDELACSQVSSERICFEITETAAISNLTSALNFISTLKAKGCRFALDDFGSGLSSFAYLKTLPVDYVKIDGRFIRDVKRDPVDREMVEAISRVAHLMGIKTIAECVERESQLKTLKAIGIDYAQGFAIGEPAPLAEALVGCNWSGAVTAPRSFFRPRVLTRAS